MYIFLVLYICITYNLRIVKIKIFKGNRVHDPASGEVTRGRGVNTAPHPAGFTNNTPTVRLPCGLPYPFSDCFTSNGQFFYRYLFIYLVLLINTYFYPTLYINTQISFSYTIFHSFYTIYSTHFHNKNSILSNGEWR